MAAHVPASVGATLLAILWLTLPIACTPPADRAIADGRSTPSASAPRSAAESTRIVPATGPAVVAATTRTAVWYRGLRRDQMIVKFADAIRVRLDGGRLSPRVPGVTAVQSVLDSFPEAKLGPLNALDPAALDRQRAEAERVSGQTLPDPNNYYLIRFPTPTSRAIELANALLRCAIVDTAYFVAQAALPATPALPGEH